MIALTKESSESDWDWEEIVRDHGSWLLNCAMRNGLRRVDAEDVAQAAWMRMFRWGVEPNRGCLSHVLNQELAEHKRRFAGRTNPKPTMSTNYDFDGWDSEPFCEPDRFEDVREMVSRLRPAWRIIAEMVMQGFLQREMAQILDISISAVKWRMHGLKRHLQHADCVARAMAERAMELEGKAKE